MSASVADLPVVVIAFGMSGCGHCDEYEPRFRSIAQRYAACVPAFFVDCTVHEAVADALGIRETPTTVIARYGQVAGKKLKGALSNEQIEKVFSRAMRGLTCEIE